MPPWDRRDFPLLRGTDRRCDRRCPAFQRRSNSARDRVNSLLGVSERADRHHRRTRIEDNRHAVHPPCPDRRQPDFRPVRRCRCASGRLSEDAFFDEAYHQFAEQQSAATADPLRRLHPTPRCRRSRKRCWKQLRKERLYPVTVNRNSYPADPRNSRILQAASHQCRVQHARATPRPPDVQRPRRSSSPSRDARPFLLQTYRRDISSRQSCLMKDVSTPITVLDHHWGEAGSGSRAPVTFLSFGLA